MRDVPISNDVDVTRLASLCDGYSGADISNVCRDAAMMVSGCDASVSTVNFESLCAVNVFVQAMRRVMTEARTRGLRGKDLRVFMEDSEQLREPVTMADFEESVRRVNSSVGGQDLQKFAKWMEDYGAA